MKRANLDKLHCPYCSSRFKLFKEINIREDDIINGIVSCNCAVFPLVDGTLFLKITDGLLLKRVLLALGDSRPREALFYLLSSERDLFKVLASGLRRLRFIPGSAARKIEISFRKLYGKKVANAGSFSKAVTATGLEHHYSDYLKYRFSSASFIASIPLISAAMADYEGDILEIGCGMGHSAFIISQLYPERKLTLVDSSFANLYLAKRFHVTNAEFICHDANNPLPFADKDFKAVFSMDAIHYIYSKSQLMREITRVSSSDSIKVFTHLHSIDGHDYCKGYSLNLGGWADLMKFPGSRIFSDKKILKDFLIENELNLSDSLSESTPEAEISNSFSVVASSRESVFKLYERIGERFFKIQNNIKINPIYRISPNNAEVVLRKICPSELFKSENEMLDSFMPETVSLSKELFRQLTSGYISVENKNSVYGLMKKFVLINKN